MASVLVIDASIAVAQAIPEEPVAARVRMALGEYDSAETALVSPDFALVEATNGVWKHHVLLRGIGREQAERALRRLPAFLGEPFPAAGLLPRAFHVAATVGATVYDCVYLALAEQRDGVMLTLDDRFVRKLNGTEWSAFARSVT